MNSVTHQVADVSIADWKHTAEGKEYQFRCGSTLLRHLASSMAVQGLLTLYVDIIMVRFLPCAPLSSPPSVVLPHYK